MPSWPTPPLLCCCLLFTPPAAGSQNSAQSWDSAATQNSRLLRNPGIAEAMRGWSTQELQSWDCSTTKGRLRNPGIVELQSQSQVFAIPEKGASGACCVWVFLCGSGSRFQFRVRDFRPRTQKVFCGQEFCGFKLTFRFCDFLDVNLFCLEVFCRRSLKFFAEELF